MTKFSSFLVFLFGILLLLAVGFTIVQRFLPKPPNSAAELIALPKSDLPDLLIPPTEDFYLQLDKLTEAQTLDALHDYVEREMVPGRTLILSASHKSESPRRLTIIDREVRRTNAQGVALLDKAPIVPRSSPNLRVGDEVILQTWTRRHISLPYYISVWGMETRL
ncbi:hypothetical protein BH11VER1_BH11VER1_01000 [soil metagenome]